ncbi:hypothetical protein AMIS_17380 [Actinoplanes missouriensis 431]|uniref:VWFA domain-containing protein n=1 Tax=Actinoplanes missouriensis (strain ATCC 14538 / DSM 43046 / CBS 188.64 / JCM 3121 / NBRC 102363 / NCIMB 12654 / NRRL B-3342 / UNCC 431) TaxID=512565 RepID=I0H1S1_ACTM4|nr:hypothetical protein [Actinoplanes missouriensis]BAL86958.1 hypothetical protein AMIS_17380 [Actinoplanes missouriensis 431]
MFADESSTTLVVDLGAAGPGAVTVTWNGVRQAARIEPVLSPQLAVTFVVDASAAGAAALPGWLSADARFALGLPAGARAAVVADRAPAAVVAAPQDGPSGIVRALGTIRAGGERDTQRSLSLALTQFPDAGNGHHVVLLCTDGMDAGELPAESVAARFREAGAILVVVGRGAYWAAATAGTGGFLAPAGDPGVAPALDQVEEVLAGRYLVRFPTPSGAGDVVVTVDGGPVVYRGSAFVESPEPGTRWWWSALPVAAVMIAAMLVGRLRRRSIAADPVNPAAAVSPAAVPPAAVPPVAGASAVGLAAVASMRPAPRGRAPVIPRASRRPGGVGFEDEE